MSSILDCHSISRFAISRFELVIIVPFLTVRNSVFLISNIGNVVIRLLGLLKLSKIISSYSMICTIYTLRCFSDRRIKKVISMNLRGNEWISSFLVLSRWSEGREFTWNEDTTTVIQKRYSEREQTWHITHLTGLMKTKLCLPRRY